MEFLLLVIINLFMGAVFYLIISFKLEKSAAEYREKRLRKEMDAVMREFNLAAERNITILENKIAVMKKLLEMNGDMKSIDVTVGGDDVRKNPESAAAEEKEPAENLFAPDAAVRGNPKPLLAAALARIGGFFESLLLLLYDLLTRNRRKSGSAVTDRPGRMPSQFEQNLDGAMQSACGPANYEDEPGRPAPSIEKDLSTVKIPGKKPEKAPPVIGEDEILMIVASSRDKYSVISELYCKGCSAEAISKYSGIPVGEINLVLNLASPR